MATLDYKVCVRRAFEPLVKASGRSDLSEKLKILPPPKEEKEAQFEKFGSMRTSGHLPLFLPNGGFFFPFFINKTQCYAFSSFLDGHDLEYCLRDWIKDNDATLDLIDQPTFLFLCYYVYNYYSLRSEFQSTRASDEQIAIAEHSDYVGHNIDDLILLFRPTYIVSVPDNSLLSGSDPYVAAAELLSMVDGLRSPIIDREFATTLVELLSFPSVNAENLFLCLTATRWRYVYLELFRIIESALFVPWIVELNQAVGSSLEIPVLYAELRKGLEWRESKGRSIEKVFSEIATDQAIMEVELRIKSFLDIVSNENYNRSAIGRRIYKIRNQLVHPEDYTDGSVLEVTEQEFRDLSLYLCDVISRIYNVYDQVLNRKAWMRRDSDIALD